jgi:MFS family permease
MYGYSSGASPLVSSDTSSRLRSGNETESSVLMYFIALYSLASFATYGLGLSQTQGAALQSILSAAQMIGRPAWGIGLDYGGRVNMTAICYLISGLSCLVIWLPANSFGVLIFFALVQGFTGGTIWSAATPLTARIVGVQDVASALSIFWVVCVPSVLVGQPIAVALLEYSEKTLGRQGAEAYYISIGLCGGMGMLSAFCLCGAKRYQQGSWKILQIT